MKLLTIPSLLNSHGTTREMFSPYSPSNRMTRMTIMISSLAPSVLLCHTTTPYISISLMTLYIDRISA